MSLSIRKIETSPNKLRKASSTFSVPAFAELYTLGKKFDRQALAILTVSDHIAKGEATTAEERQKTFTQMMEIALEAAIAE